MRALHAVRCRVRVERDDAQLGRVSLQGRLGLLYLPIVVLRELELVIAVLLLIDKSFLLFLDHILLRLLIMRL